MRRPKNTIMLTMLLAAACQTFTSCLGGDDDDSKLTQEKLNEAMAVISGSYRSTVYFEDGKGVDSLGNVTLGVSNEGLFVDNFPLAAFATSVQGNDSVQAGLRRGGNIHLNAGMAFYDLESDYYFTLSPATTTAKIYYGGTEHELQFTFSNDVLGSAGVYNKEKKNLELMFGIQRVLLDNRMDLLSGKAIIQIKSKNKFS